MKTTTTSILRGAEFLSNIRQEEVHSWFDTFCKTIPFQISSAKLKQQPDDENAENLCITCKTPLQREVGVLIEALDSDDEMIIDRAIALVEESFDDLIKKANLPNKAQIAGREIALTWMPEELSLFEKELCTPQEESISEFNLRTMVCLETVNIVMDSDRIFVKKWACSNDPFLSAGLLATGDWVWLDKFEMETVSTKESRGLLRERIGQHPGRYIMLLRLALLAKYDGDLQQSWGQIKQFGTRVWLSKVNWQYWTATILEGESISDDEMALPMDVYMRLNQEVEMLGSLLMAGLEGQEREISRMINMALAHVQIPQPPLFKRWQQ